MFVTGASIVGPSGNDYATAAYSASTGAQLWVRRYTRSGDDTPDALGVSPDGSKVLVGGFSQGPTSGYDYATLAYSVK